MEAATARLPAPAFRPSDRLTAEEVLAARCAAPLLITALFPFTVRAIARRVHAASPRAAAPLLHTSVHAFPVDDPRPLEFWSALLARADGGSLLLTHLEDAPAIVQEQLITVLDDLTDARRAGTAAVRLMGGTTACLADRVALGTFSDRLFYRLNVLHIEAHNTVII